MHFKYYLIYKPYQVLSQFTSEGGKRCLKDFFSVEKDVYPVGRLDYDSEGLLILTNDKSLNEKLLHPQYHHNRTYWVQVDGAITDEAIQLLQNGRLTININGKDHRTQPVQVSILTNLQVPERNPPVRFRKTVPTSWVSITLQEGKNRQVRKMMAKVGFPVLRLIRISIEDIKLANMQPGEIISVSRTLIYQKLFGK